MSWAKLDDNFHEDCDDAELSPAAITLHVYGITWTMKNNNRNEGRIQRPHVRRFAGRFSDDVLSAAIHELTTKTIPGPDGQPMTFWEDHQDHFQIVHNMEQQRTYEQIKALSARNRVNGKAGGRPPKETQVETDMETQMGLEGSETQMGTQVGTQMETQRVWPGQEGSTKHLEGSMDMDTGDFTSTLPPAPGAAPGPSELFGDDPVVHAWESPYESADWDAPPVPAFVRRSA